MWAFSLNADLFYRRNSFLIHDQDEILRSNEGEVSVEDVNPRSAVFHVPIIRPTGLQE